VTGESSGRVPARLAWLAELRSAAMTLAGHGWPVLRGTYSEGGRWYGRPDAVSLRPLADDWPSSWTSRPVQVANWWNTKPYSVLVACGQGVDCIELPGSHGHRMLAPLREAGLSPPAMYTPVGTLVLFVRTNRGPRPNLVSVSLRSTDSWVPVPPTGQYLDHGPDAAGYRWVSDASPGCVGWELPELHPVCEVITSTIRADADRTPPS